MFNIDISKIKKNNWTLDLKVYMQMVPEYQGQIHEKIGQNI